MNRDNLITYLEGNLPAIYEQVNNGYIDKLCFRITTQHHDTDVSLYNDKYRICMCPRQGAFYLSVWIVDDWIQTDLYPLINKPTMLNQIAHKLLEYKDLMPALEWYQLNAFLHILVDRLTDEF